MEKLLLRPAEVAETLGIARSRAYMLIASGDLPSVRLGKSVRVPLEGLRSWIALHEEQSPEAEAARVVWRTAVPARNAVEGSRGDRGAK